MYIMLSSENIVDIVMFINNNGIGTNPDYVVSTYNNLMDFDMRRLRNLFFNYRVIGYADVKEENGEILSVKDVVLYTRSVAQNASHIYLSLSPKNNTDFLKYTLKDVLKNNQDINKIRAVTTKKALLRGFQSAWEDAGFRYELGLREFEDEKENVVSYAYFREGKV